MISEIITVFLLKAKAQKQSAYMIEGLKHILDRQNQFIYVVEPETYRVLYANQKTCEVMGGLELGGQCHMYFFRRDTPCEGCPLVMLKEQETAQTELYSEVVKKTLIVDVSHITWLGHMSAYLVACSQKKSWEEDVDCFDADPYRCGVIDCFNEMVKAGVKRIAMAHPSKTRHERDLLLPFSRNICRKYKTNFYVEDDPLLTDLFPVSLNRNTYNLIFYRDSHWLDVYLNLKGRKQTLIDSNCYSGKARTQLALDFGALLSYPEEDCVEMIRQNREKES